jgi:hypothetical protein
MLIQRVAVACRISMDASSIAMEALDALQKADEPWPV